MLHCARIVYKAMDDHRNAVDVIILMCPWSGVWAGTEFYAL